MPHPWDTLYNALQNLENRNGYGGEIFNNRGIRFKVLHYSVIPYIHSLQNCTLDEIINLSLSFDNRHVIYSISNISIGIGPAFYP